jgi:hypothetical protein
LSSDAERTQKIAPLDPNFRPEAAKVDSTQRLDAVKPPPPEPGASEAETTQRIDDSIWRLQEAKRILQGIQQK